MGFYKAVKFDRRNAFLAAFAAAATLLLGQGDAPDRIYVNGTVITMNGAQIVQAVAVRGDRIVGAGSNADIRKMGGPRATVIDLKGKTMLPGFIDAHSHLTMAGDWALFMVNLSAPPLGKINNIDDLVAALHAKALETPKGQWIRGTSYDQTLLAEKRHPTRWDLDKASTDHPIYITHVSDHLFVANSLALKMAGITKDTPKPNGGVIEKDPKTGEPNGVIEESGQMVARLVPRLTPGQQLEAIQWAVQDYVSHGVSTATMAGGGIGKELEAAEKAGQIPLRVVAMMHGPLEGDFPPAHMIGNEMMKTGLTIGEDPHDGSPQGCTAYFRKPYYTNCSGDPTYRGYPRESLDELVAKVKKYNRLGYQIAIHANGDAAIDDVIYAYREAQKDFPRTDARFRIDHAQATHDEQLDQMKELGISPSFFVSHTYYWGDQHRDLFMGPELGSHISPLRSAINRGIRFSIHLDTPVTPMSPLQAVWSAVNRVTRTDKVLGPEQRITPLEALRAVTIDAAWQEHDEKIKGSIEPAKFADFVVLADNPLTIDPMKIKDMQVLETIVGGKSVYKRQ
jgi:predicted amidohydrolase YtcJ